MGWHYFQKFLSQNFTLGRKEPTALIHWLEMVQGKHGISIHRAAAGGCQSVSAAGSHEGNLNAFSLATISLTYRAQIHLSTRVQGTATPWSH